MSRNFIVRNWKKIVLVLVILSTGLLFIRSKAATKDVKTSIVEKGPIKEELVLSGEVGAVNYAKLYFETSGKIVYVGVKEGEKVKKGRLLTKIDTTILNSSYQQALSALRAKEATLSNVHDQVKDHASDETYAQKDTRTTAEANKDSAYESVIQAKRNLDGASLFAPFDGIVTYLANPFSGVNALYTQSQVEIIDPSTMYFSVLADQTEVTQITQGMKTEIVFDSFEEKIFKGSVRSVSFAPKTGESGSVYEIRVEFEDLDLEKSGLRIAMTGDAKFITREKSDVLYAPNNFIKTDKSGKYLKLDLKGKNKVYVETGLESEDYIEVIGEISPGVTIYD